LSNASLWRSSSLGRRRTLGAFALYRFFEQGKIDELF
jgi:hypothetical protein